jgi:hypothetical protein
MFFFVRLTDTQESLYVTLSTLSPNTYFNQVLNILKYKIL